MLSQQLRRAALRICARDFGERLTASFSAGVPRRPLGKTGEKVSMLGLGGWHIGFIEDERNAIELVQTAIDMGVTFLDNAWEYHEGRSEEIVGKALRQGYRGKVFLMTKHHGRDKKTALRHLEDSLKRLHTDVIDLWQFHEVIYEDDADKILAAAGGLEAAQEAKKAGKVRYIGFTGHKDPRFFAKMLESGCEWDTVQMPVNVLDTHFRSFQKDILPILVERKIGVIAMKTLACGHLLRANVVSPEEALTYAWSQPISTLVSGIDTLGVLFTNVRMARNFKPMPKDEQAKLLGRTREAALTGEFEPFKTTREFDGWVGQQAHGVSE